MTSRSLMNRSQARRLLGLPLTFTDADVERAFRRQARATHPDQGGDTRAFRDCIEARHVLLEHLRFRSPVMFVAPAPWPQRLADSVLARRKHPKRVI